MRERHPGGVPELQTHTTVTSLASVDDAAAFREISEAWISRLFSVTTDDRRLLDDPLGQIVEPGGDVLLARAASGGVVGCVALLPYGEGVFELAKMGVTPESQGAGVGRRLIAAAIERAPQLGGRLVFLGSHSSLRAALHLYEAAGFVRITREQLPVDDYSARADTFMRLELD